MHDESPLPPMLGTERLVMRPVTLDDLPFLTELHLDPEVTRFLGGDGSARPPEKTRAWLDDTMLWNREAGVGQYLVTERSTGRPLGRAGLGSFEIEVTPTGGEGVPVMSWGPNSAVPGTPVRYILEVGYTFAREAWGAGYATEAAAVWYTWSLASRASAVYSVIHPENIGSTRVAQKNGLTFDGKRAWLDGSIYHLWSRSRD